jgi:Zn-dependent protease with chaperone function
MKKYTKILILSLLICNTIFAETFHYQDEFNAWWNERFKNITNIYPGMLDLRIQVENSLKIQENMLPKLHGFVADLCKKNNIGKPLIIIPQNEHEFNAFAIKIFRDNGIVFILPKIFKNLNDDEFEAIIAHEIGHIKHNHANKTLAISAVVGVGLYCLFLGILGYYLDLYEVSEKISQLGLQNVKNYSSHLLAASSSLLAIMTRPSLTKLIIGKKFEKQADNFAMENNHANGLKSAMKKMDFQDSFDDTLKYIEDNKESLSKDDYEKHIKNWQILAERYKAFLKSDCHPTCEERIKAAEEYLNNQNQESQGQLAIA